jgi:hypothetical protein
VRTKSVSRHAFAFRYTGGVRCAVLLVLALSACVASPPDGPGVLGSASDVTTQPGDHSTYRVITGCAAANYGVIGAGSVTLGTTDDIAHAGGELYAELRTIPSVWGGGGVGLACTSGVVGTAIDLADWRDVDSVIALTGEWLHARDLALEVAISVRSVPVAVAD